MTRSVWLKADDTVGDWETRKRRITAGLEAGVDWVLVDEGDIGRVRDLGDVSVAAFRTNAETTLIDDVADGSGDDEDDPVDAETFGTGDSNTVTDPDAYVVGKCGEGDGTVDLPSDFSGSADLTTLRRGDDRAQGAYVRILSEEYEAFAEAAAADADYTLVIGEDWTIIPLENLIARIGEETDLIAGSRPRRRPRPRSRPWRSAPMACCSTPTIPTRSDEPSRCATTPSARRSIYSGQR